MTLIKREIRAAFDGYNSLLLEICSDNRECVVGMFSDSYGIVNNHLRLFWPYLTFLSQVARSLNRNI